VEYKLRGIVYEPRFEQELAALLPDARKADDFIVGTCFILARQPDYGSQISPGSWVWFLPMVDAPGTKPVVLYYMFDNHDVYFMSIREADIGGGSPLEE
jgi:hypothetical protein